LSGAESPYEEREYRRIVEPEGLSCYRVVLGESDLLVCTSGPLEREAAEALERVRAQLEAYLRAHPDFGTSFRPVPAVTGAPLVVREMAEAAEVFDVGPMASVAGAVAQHVGEALLGTSDEVIVENGGDIFLAGMVPRKVRVFAGGDPPSVDVTVDARQQGLGICTSSGCVGPSVSLGVADAVTVLAATATLADAAATALGNRLFEPGDIEPVLELAASSDLIDGALVAVGGSVGVWGELRLG